MIAEHYQRISRGSGSWSTSTPRSAPAARATCTRSEKTRASGWTWGWRSFALSSPDVPNTPAEPAKVASCRPRPRARFDRGRTADIPIVCRSTGGIKSMPARASRYGDAGSRRGMPKIEGDSRRAPARGRSAPDGWFGCADRGFSRRDLGYASCRTALLRWRYMDCGRFVHRAQIASLRRSRLCSDRSRNAEPAVRPFIARRSRRAAYARSSKSPSNGSSAI
jgi:hypothetical protein